MAELHVTVCISPAPRVVWSWALTLPSGSGVQDALQAAMCQPEALAWPWPPEPEGGRAQWAHWSPGIWGRKCRWDTPLQEGDRVELCRPLRVDPKVARRERFQQQGARTAGLFAARRPPAPPRKGPR